MTEPWRVTAQEASGLLATAVETAEAGGRLTTAWVAAASAMADELERHYTLAPCGHPAVCERDGACGWCAAVEDVRLALEVRDAAREASACDLERRREVEARAIAVERDALARGAHQTGDAVARAEAAEAERDELAAHVARLREALRWAAEVLDGVSDAEDHYLTQRLDWRGSVSVVTAVHSEIQAAPAATPSASLEEHDRGVAARALRALADEVCLYAAGQCNSGRCPCGPARRRAAAIEQGGRS